MSQELDLFAAAEPKTCGSCGASACGKGGPYCELSCASIKLDAPGCGWHYPKEQK